MGKSRPSLARWGRLTSGASTLIATTRTPRAWNWEIRCWKPRNSELPVGHQYPGDGEVREDGDETEQADEDEHESRPDRPVPASLGGGFHNGILSSHARICKHANYSGRAKCRRAADRQSPGGPSRSDRSCLPS